MFDSICGQKDPLELLRSDISKGRVANSMIFYGPRYSGKLTTALELMRILNCREYRLDDCECANCKRIQSLDFEGLIFLSRRDFGNQIKELIRSYSENQEKKYAERIFYLTKLSSIPLQDFLTEHGLSETERSIINKNLERIWEIQISEKIRPKDLEEVLESYKKITSTYKRMNIPIDMIRNMLEWTYISHPDIKRVVIIDHIDELEKPSQNILLKRLEEPSDNLYFILLCENKNRVIQTIRSRCRFFIFREHYKDDLAKIIDREYGVKGQYPSLNAFLSRSDESSKENVYPMAVKLINLVFLKEAPFSELNFFLSSGLDRKIVRSILMIISEMIEKELYRREIGLLEETEKSVFRETDSNDLETLKEIITKKYNIMDIYSLNPTWVLEGIFYPMKALIKK